MGQQGGSQRIDFGGTHYKFNIFRGGVLGGGLETATNGDSNLDDLFGIAAQEPAGIDAKVSRELMAHCLLVLGCLLRMRDAVRGERVAVGGERWC